MSGSDACEMSDLTRLPRATFIRASAGTGKTFQLSNRYLRLLVDGHRPDSILASTFTRKAAGEILERVIQRLARAAASESEACDLSEHLQIDPLASYQFAEHLVNLLRRLDRCRISTLDAYFGQLARAYCLELGLSPSWTILDDSQSADFQREAIRNTLAEGHAHELIHLLAKGASTRSIIQLATNTVSELYGYYLDGSPDAWQQLPEPHLLSTEQLEQLTVQLRDFSCDAASINSAVERDVELLLAGEFEQILGKGVAPKVLAGETKFNRATIPDQLVTIYRQIGQHAAGLKLHSHRQHLEGARKLLETYHQHYRQLKRSARGMQFDDVTRAIDQGWGYVANVGADSREESPLEHLLLDEFQDTSPAQWRSLAPQVQAALDKSGTLMIVGDTKQAIYGWRGGDARLFDAVEDWIENDRTIQTLDVSRRSAQSVLDVVNRVFEYAKATKDWEDAEKGVTQWTAGYIEHRSAFESRSGYARLEGAAEPLDRAVEIAKELYESTTHCSIALLVRSNVDVGRLISKLTLAQVPASEEAGKSIADSPSVQIVLSALHLVDHPSDSIARFHLSLTPLGETWGLLPEPQGSEQNAQIVEQLAARERRELVEQGYGPTIERWTQALAQHNDERELRRLSQLVDLAFHYDPKATLRPSDFVRYVEREKVSDPSSERVRVMNFHQAKGLEFDAVILPDLDRAWIGMRPAFVAHRPSVTDPISVVAPYISKTFRHLVDPKLVEWSQQWEAEQIAENMSMFYVAMTRAARALYLVAPQCKADAKLTKWSHLLIHALRPGEAITEGVVAYEHGAADWFVEADREIADRQSEEPEPRVLTCEPLALGPSQPRLARQLRSASPSSREGGFKIRVSDLFRQGNAAALARGTAIHALFEQVQWLSLNESIDSLSQEQLRNCLMQLEETPHDVQAIIDSFRLMLEQPRTRSLFDQSSQHAWAQSQWPELAGPKLCSSVSNEHRFVLFEPDPQGEPGQLQLCAGIIDRLVRFQSGVEQAALIVDFKTDSISPGDTDSLQKRVAHYRPQIQAYRQAVARLLKLPPHRIAAQLAFVEIDALVEIMD